MMDMSVIVVSGVIVDGLFGYDEDNNATRAVENLNTSHSFKSNVCDNNVYKTQMCVSLY